MEPASSPRSARSCASARRPGPGSRATILQFQGTWNGFFWPFCFLAGAGGPLHPSYGVYSSDGWLGYFVENSTGRRSWPSSSMATIPPIVIYVFFQRYFVEGIAASGVKG